MLSSSEVAQFWYRSSDVEIPIAQGDQLWGLSLLDAFADDSGTVRVERRRASLIVLTQSCDLEHGKVTSVLTSPMYPLSEWLQANPSDLLRLEDIRRGYNPSLYLLPSWPAAPVVSSRVDRVVDFGELRILSFAVLQSGVKAGIDRVVLSSPAREHFSQAVARTFMRVGLPADIPSFDLKRQAEDEVVASELPFGDAGYHLVKPLRLARRCYVRTQTGDNYWLVSTKGENPSLQGAGGDESEARASLAAQVVVAIGKLREGDLKWSWLEDYLSRG